MTVSNVIGGKQLRKVDMDRIEEGSRIRREVLGDEYVDRVTRAAAGPWVDLQTLVREYCWGGLWSRKGLSRRERSLVTLAILGTLGRHEEVAAHVGGAIRNGATEEEIAEVALHLAIYAGIPTALAAARVAQDTLAQSADNG
jgi:4-carboxymuconolactone decarboxylase